MEIDRRQFLMLSGTSLITGCSIGGDIKIIKPSLEKILEISFEDAAKDESIRQAYLDQFLEIYDMPEVEQIIYDPELKHYEKQMMKIDSGYLEKQKKKSENDRKIELLYLLNQNAFVVFDNNTMGKRKKHPIFAPKTFFEGFVIACEADAASTLKGHEYVHVKDLYYGIKLGDIFLNHKNIMRLSINSRVAVFEARANYNQLKETLDNARFVNGKIDIGSIKVSNDFYQRNCRIYGRFSQTLFMEALKGGFEGEICKRQYKLISDIFYDYAKEDIVYDRRPFGAILRLISKG